MRKLLTIAAACAALAAVPGAAMAQGQSAGQTTADTPSASNMKGSPNANGFGKSNESGSTTPKEETPSASNLKGSPNANGFKKP